MAQKIAEAPDDPAWAELEARTQFPETAPTKGAIKGDSVHRLGMTLLAVVMGGIVLLVAGVLGFLVWGTKPIGQSTATERTRPPILVNVSTTGGLGQALRKARPGDRIVLQVDLQEVNVVVDKPNITIEAEAGKKVLWKCPANVPDAYSKLLNIQAPNVTFRGGTLDGNDKTEELILVFGKCPGVKLENLTLRNTKQYGVLILNCEGDSDDPGQLNDLEFLTTPTTTALRFDIGGGHQIIKQNRFIAFGNCHFEGTGKKLTAPNQEFFDPATIKLPERITKIDIVP